MEKGHQEPRKASCGRLEGVKAAQLNDYKKMVSQPFEGGQKTTTRTLKAELSEVSVESLGLAKVASASESDDSRENESMSEADRLAACSKPPPVGKKEWRTGAMKRPYCSSEIAKNETSSKSCKKPSASRGFSDGSSKKPATEADPIHAETLRIGGGKVQSYIQHRPGFCKSKKLIVAITSGQAERTSKSHKDLIQLLMSACKKPGATKESVLAHRANLLRQHALHKG